MLVIPELHVLRATKRQLSEHLLHLVAEFLNLLGQLPIHVIALALCDLLLVFGGVAENVRAHRTIRREQFFDRAGHEVHARLGHHRMHDS